ncbi:MAG: tetratricopeptide repeat protein [Candidatus Methylomirabilales bacterium]
MKILRLFSWMVVLVLFLAGCAKKAEVDPLRSAETHYQLGLAYFNSGNYQLSLPELAKAVELNPSEPLYHDALGMSFMFNRQLDAAISEFQEALRLDPKFVEAKNNLASAYLLKGDLKMARATLEEVLKDPFYATPQFAYFNLARILEREGKIDDAIRDYRRALDLEQNFVDAHNNLGRLYLQQGKVDLAIEEFAEATRLRPRVALYHRNLGVAYVQAGETKKARMSFNRVLDLEREGPSAEYARKMLEELKR